MQSSRHVIYYWQHTFERCEALAAGASLGERHLVLGFALQALAHERVERRQPVQQRRGVLGLQRALGQARVEEGPQPVHVPVQLVVLLGRLDDGRVVHPAEALQLLGLLGDAVEFLEHVLQQLFALCLAGLWLLRRIVRLRE